MSADINEINVRITVDEEFEEALQLASKEAVNDAVSQASGGVDSISSGNELGAGQVAGFAKSGFGKPAVATSMLMPLIPHLIPLMIASGAAIQLFDWAVGAGGPLDLRYRRMLIDEANNFMSRQLSRDTGIGDRQVIIAANSNFKNLGGAGSSNTLNQIRESGTRQAQIGLLVTDQAQGLERFG